ncbi:MAG: hypothetical protein JW940_11505 [Polyangiaceae bacterium]|nr:hypothetical protein [Polyangiaceae bacterium]
MTSLKDPSDESRIRRELDALAKRWSEILSRAEREVVRTEYRSVSAYAVLPLWFELSNLSPGKLLDAQPSKGGVRYGLDAQGRVQTAQHFEGTRLTVRIAALYEPGQNIWLRRTDDEDTFVELVRLSEGRPVEWYKTGEDSLRLCRGVYDEQGRLLEVRNQSVTSLGKEELTETRDRLVYDVNDVVVRITRSGTNADRVIYRAKASSGSRKARNDGLSAAAKTVDVIAPRVGRFLKEHAEREALAVAIAYDEEITVPAAPLLGIIWRDDFQRLLEKGWDLLDILNPAEHESFDIPALSLEQAEVGPFLPAVGSQREFYVGVARSLAARFSASPSLLQRSVVVYTTDLECSHLRRNLDELGIGNIAAAFARVTGT